MAGATSQLEHEGNYAYCGFSAEGKSRIYRMQKNRAVQELVERGLRR